MEPVAVHEEVLPVEDCKQSLHTSSEVDEALPLLKDGVNESARRLKGVLHDGSVSRRVHRNTQRRARHEMVDVRRRCS